MILLIPLYDTKGDEQTVEQFLLRTKIKKADRHNHSDSTLSLRELCGVGPQHEDVLDNKSIYLPNYELLAKKNFKIKQQCTWAGYIKLLHAIWNPNSGEKRPWTNEQINHYQAHHLGEPRNTVERSAETAKPICAKQLSSKLNLQNGCAMAKEKSNSG